jgi:hypothetical protein
MNKSDLITEHLAMGLLNTEKPLVFGVLNTANYDLMGFVFVAGDDSGCLEDVGCFPEDIEKADLMEVGGTMFGGWPDDRAIIIVKMKDDRFSKK